MWHTVVIGRHLSSMEPRIRRAMWAAGETPLEEIVRLSEACGVRTYPSGWTGGRRSLVDE